MIISSCQQQQQIYSTDIFKSLPVSKFVDCVRVKPTIRERKVFLVALFRNKGSGFLGSGIHFRFQLLGPRDKNISEGTQD